MRHKNSLISDAPDVVRRTLRACAAAAVALLVVLAAPVGMTAVAVPGPGAAGTVYVQTVPALAGVRLSVAGVSVTTGRYGRAQVQLSNINGVAHRVTLAHRQVDSRTTVALSRVSPAPHTTPHTSSLEVGLDVTSVVSLTVDAGNSGTQAAAVSALTLHSISGKKLMVRPRTGATVGLLSRRAVLKAGVLQTQTITWSVDHVATISAAAVTTNSPRFDPFTHSLWKVRLAPVAGTVAVETVPATPGVMLIVGGQTVTTDGRGRGSAGVSDLNSVTSGVRLATTQARESNVELLTVTKLRPSAPRNRRMLLALKISDPVTFQFVDPRGRVIPLNRVGLVRLEQAGHRLTIGAGELTGPVLLPTSVAQRAHDAWRTVRLDYSIATVSVAGANAVFRGQRRFSPRTHHLWRVQLSVYDMSITVRDALFGRRTSSSVQVTLPNGRQKLLHIDDRAPTVVPSLVRGTYHLTVASAVIGADNTVLVSQNGAADLRVITLLDVVVILSVVALLAAALIVTGRRLAQRSTEKFLGQHP